ncbi:putative LRR receptor serine/threonine-protein kinase [Trifolium repens]|nr:putative LRR receptor serine/threonine-protein kinase [Trifolium repens]
MVGMFLHFLLVLLGVLSILVSIQAQDQSGFISIDCGLPEHLNFSSTTTTINYISDANFINTGVSKRIELIGNNADIPQQLEYVRSFPDGVKNCYKIDVTNGTKYLIRASFYYGNYDDLNEPPQFDLYFGANLWDTINASLYRPTEIIYTPSQDYIQPCLVNTGNGTPFISTIELRPLNNETYVTDSAKSALSRFTRLDIGSITNLQYRYKDDVYDRLWKPFQSNGKKNLSTNNNDLFIQNIYEPPVIVMNTAVTPVNESAPLQYYWDADDVTDEYYLYLYFNEVEELTASDTRAFNITVNDEFWYGPVIPKYGVAFTVFSRGPLTKAATYTTSQNQKLNRMMMFEGGSSAIKFSWSVCIFVILLVLVMWKGSTAVMDDY